MGIANPKESACKSERNVTRKAQESGLRSRFDSALELETRPAARRQKPPVRVLIVVPDVMTGEYITEKLKTKGAYFHAKVLIGRGTTIPREVAAFEPHVTLLSDDLEDGPQEGFKILRELKRSKATTAVVMLLKRSNPECVISAFRFGARGIVYRSHSFKSLPKCLQIVHEGQIWIGNEDLEHILDWLGRVNSVTIAAADGSPLLTSREQDVVRLVTDGMKNREIAEALSLTEHSVRNYLYRIFEKLGVSSRAELMLYALSRRGVELNPGGLGSASGGVTPRSERAN